MKQQAVPGASDVDVSQQSAAVEAATSEQDLLGNQAMLEAMDEQSKAPGDAVKEAEESKSTDGPTEDPDHDLQPVLGPDTPDILVDAMREHEEAEKEAEEEAQEPPDLAKRASSIRPGMTGAVLGSKETYDVKADASTEASSSDTITDGTFVTVTDVNGTHVEIEYRKGTSMTTGWVNAALFSPQPKLAKDDDDKSLPENVSYELAEGDQSPGEEIKGTDVEQGGLADCFFIASMNAIASANPEFLREAITYDSSSGLYTVRFYERGNYNYQTGSFDYSEHTEVVDGYLPQKADGTNAYAEAKNASEWGAIYEKAYAQWKGGYDVLDKGGSSAKAMQELTGVQSVPKNVGDLKADEVIPFFENAEAQGTAVICGSLESMESETLTPLEGGPVANTEAPSPTAEEGQAATEASATETETETSVDTPAVEEPSEALRHPGPYKGTVTLGHDYQRIKPGTVSVTDKNGNVGTARDGGSRGDKESSLSGGDVKDGKIVYKPKQMELLYNDGKGPDQASDLEVKLRYQGLIYPSKKVFAWHAYVFQGVQDGKIKLYNPWGSWHPDPLTAEEFLTYYSNLSTNQVPQTKETEATE